MNLCTTLFEAGIKPRWRRRFLPTLCWARVSDDFGTHIQIFNYLPYLGSAQDAQACLEIALFSERGTGVAFWRDTLGPRESRFVDLGDVLKNVKPFQGSATVRLWPLGGLEGLHQQPVWTTEFFTRYWVPGRGGSIVHNLQAVSYAPFTYPGAEIATSPFWLDDGRDSALILFNTFWSPGLWSNGESSFARIHVSNTAGQIRTWAVPGGPIPPRGSRLVRLRELAGLREFLGGQWGGVSVEGRNISKRFLIWTEDSGLGDFNIHHN